MKICSRSECQTTAGCQCNAKFTPNWRLSPAESMAVENLMIFREDEPKPTPFIPTTDVDGALREAYQDLTALKPDGFGGDRPAWPEEKEDLLDPDLLIRAADEIKRLRGALEKFQS